MTADDEGVDLTKNGDRGVLKRIIKEGEGTDTPAPGCQVTVHYTGTLLDGTKFDSSRDRNEPFEFILGKGAVIAAWELGAASMRRGERSALTCAPAYAYGAAGHAPRIPPHATLVFEIEMLKWEDEDLSPSKNKGILRHILEPGTGYDTPNDGALVTVELEGRALPAPGAEPAPGAAEAPPIEARTVTFRLGEGAALGVCEGVERALERFRAGERARLTLAARWAPAGAGAARYTVRLRAFTRAREPWALDAAERLAEARLYKEKGSEYFRGGSAPLAARMYRRAAALLDCDELAGAGSQADAPGSQADAPGSLRAEARALAVAVFLNLSLAHLRAAPAQARAARAAAERALALDPASVKGRFRRGLALLQLGEAERALEDFRRVMELEPGNKAAAAQAAAAQAAAARQRAREKQLYANMFDKFAKHDAEAEAWRARAAAALGAVGEWEWSPRQRAREPTSFEKENPNILMLDRDGQFRNM